MRATEKTATCLDSAAWKARMAAKKLLAEEMAKLSRAKRGTTDDTKDITDRAIVAAGARPA